MGIATALPRRRQESVALQGRWANVLGISVVTALGAVLRFWSFPGVRMNPYYDAAVRSMSLSWHNFFYGAFEPGGSVSIDKTPLDLWLQVASVKAFGFSSLALRLPEALASAAAVPLLYDLVRRLFGRPAGFAAGAALAVMPVSVVTGRSDTMDSMMMALLVLAAWLVVRSAQEDRPRLLLTAGAVLGLAFNVKMFQALVAVPPLTVLYLMAADSPLRARLLRLAGAGVALVTVSLSWVAVASLAPLGSRPFPIGSANGSIWNVVFGFNGIDRLNVGPTAKAQAIDPSGPTRLFTTHGLFYGSLVGTELLAALVLGAVALVFAAVTHQRRPAAGSEATGSRAGVAAIGLWLVLGTVLFSMMGRLHPRYLEAFTPAIAATLGISVVSLAAAAGRRRGAAMALGAGTAVSVLVGLTFARAGSATTAVVIAAVLVAVVACLTIARTAAGPGRTWSATLIGVVLVAVLAAPLTKSAHLASAHASDGGIAGAMPAAQVDSLSRFLKAHRAGAHYEFVAPAVAVAGPLIVHDTQPVLMLTSLYGRPLTSVKQLATAVRTGQARYALLGKGRCKRPGEHVPDCAPAVLWARSHSFDVSARAGVRAGLLYRLTSSATSAKAAAAPVHSANHHAHAATTVIGQLLHEAKLRYGEEVHGIAVHKQLRRIAADSALLQALSTHDLTSLRTAVGLEQKTKHAHVSRLRVMQGTRVLADAGVPFVVAPSAMTLRDAAGHAIGTLQVSIQDEIGYVRYMHRNFPVDVVVRGSRPNHVRTSLRAALNVKLPDRGSVTIAGRRYQVRSFHREALGHEPVKIWILARG